MDNIVPGSFQLMKKINTGLILDCIRLKGTISRADIAKKLNITPATVTNITANLIKQDIIVEGDLGISSGGRKPILLRINSNAFYIVAIQIENKKIKTGILNMESKILDMNIIHINKNMDYEEIERIIKSEIRNITKRNNILKSKILGIGVSANGIVDFELGEIIYSPFFGWKNLKLRDILEKEFDVPVYIDRDVRSLALSESWYGEGKENSLFICINVGQGIEAAIMENKQQIRGVKDGYSDFGCTTINLDFKFNDKQSGYLETFASEEAVYKCCFKNGYLGELDIDKLNKELNNNKIVIEAYKKAGMYLGVGIVNLINIFAPPLIIVGGNLVENNDLYFNSMIDYIKKNTMEELYNSINIKRASSGANGILKGSSVLVLDNLFDSFQ